MRMEYRCRRCGKIDDSTGIVDKNAMHVMVSVVSGCDTHLMEPQPRLIGVHSCKDGGFGVTDFIGCRIDDASTQG